VLKVTDGFASLRFKFRESRLFPAKEDAEAGLPKKTTPRSCFMKDGGNMESRVIAACGNDCSACPRYVTYPFVKTEEELHHTAELWMQIGYRDHVVSNQEIACTGCKPENWCRYHVVKCCEDRGIRTCAECPEYPCDNMKECFAVTRSFEPKCREVCTDEEYKQLKTAFFEKEKNLSPIYAPGGTRHGSGSCHPALLQSACRICKT